MPIPRADNIGLDVAERICDKYGFEKVRAKRAFGQFSLSVDAQHAVVMQLSPWQQKGGGGERVSVLFGLVRRDINLTQELIFGNTKGDWYPTLREKSYFLGRPQASWLFYADRAEVYDWIDTWVPRVATEAASLRFIEDYWEIPLRDSLTDQMRLSTQVDRAWPRITNQLLWGWSEESEKELFSPLYERVAQLEDSHPHRVDIETKISAARAWASEHPNGVERELTD